MDCQRIVKQHYTFSYFTVTHSFTQLCVQPPVWGQLNLTLMVETADKASYIFGFIVFYFYSSALLSFFPVCYK